MRRGNLPDGGLDKVTWKRSRDLVTRCRDNVTLGRSGDVWQPHYWVFHLELKGDVVESTNGTLWIRTTETSWWRISETSLGVSFETCLRRCGDVLMERCCQVLLKRHPNVPIRHWRDVSIRCLGDVPSRHPWLFYLRRTRNITRTSREALLRRRQDVLLQEVM